MGAAKPAEDPITELKSAGNEHLKAGRPTEAHDAYTAALDLDPERTHADAAALLVNRALVQLKLSGGNSAKITLKELSFSVKSDVRKRKAELDRVVLGPRGSLRRSLPLNGLSVREQVDVLVEQATDDNLLGRTWIGWAPWL